MPDVQLVGMDVPAGGCRYLACDHFTSGQIPTGDHHVSSCGRQTPGDRFSDAAPTPGDHRHLAREIEELCGRFRPSVSAQTCLPRAHYDPARSSRSKALGVAMSNGAPKTAQGAERCAEDSGGCRTVHHAQPVEVVARPRPGCTDGARRRRSWPACHYGAGGAGGADTAARAARRSVATQETKHRSLRSAIS
jgi:hypothetical protein